MAKIDPPYRFDPLQLCNGAQWSEKRPPADRIEIDSYANGGSCFWRRMPRFGVNQGGWGASSEVDFAVLGVYPRGSMTVNTEVFYKYPGYLYGSRGSSSGYTKHEIDSFDLPGGTLANTATPIVFGADPAAGGGLGFDGWYAINGGAHPGEDQTPVYPGGGGGGSGRFMWLTATGGSPDSVAIDLMALGQVYHEAGIEIDPDTGLYPPATGSTTMIHFGNAYRGFLQARLYLKGKVIATAELDLTQGAPGFPTIAYLAVDCVYPGVRGMIEFADVQYTDGAHDFQVWN